MRADAERTIERILTGAPAVLNADPAASTEKIASGLGLGRATLYRHFPSREKLLFAIHERALEDAERAVSAAQPEQGSASSALRRLIDHVMEVGDRYRFLNGVAARDERLQATEERVGAPLVALIERGQAASEIRTDRAPRFLAGQLSGLLAAGIAQVERGEASLSAAAEAVYETFMHGVSG